MLPRINTEFEWMGGGGRGRCRRRWENYIKIEPRKLTMVNRIEPIHITMQKKKNYQRYTIWLYQL
jgi:hypothetical protein